MIQILPTIESPIQLHPMSVDQLEQVADEIRETLCNLLSLRAAHFASNSWCRRINACPAQYV